ncbi:MAG TPA: hypothetical protein VGH13_20435 [Xanthobacteraceae bacterium]|jgi:hypothetical protein
MAQTDYVTNAIRPLSTGPSALPSTNSVGAAYAAFLAAVARHPPRTIPCAADAADLENRADHLNQLLTALSAYLNAVLADTAQNVAGGLDLRQFDALLSDLTSDVTGTLQRVAEDRARRSP